LGLQKSNNIEYRIIKQEVDPIPLTLGLWPQKLTLFVAYMPAYPFIRFSVCQCANSLLIDPTNTDTRQYSAVYNNPH
jgi:hypothetical protein